MYCLVGTAAPARTVVGLSNEMPLFRASTQPNEHGPIIWRAQTCQPSRFWLDSPAFLPGVPRPAKSWNVPLFVRRQIYFCAQFVTLPRCPIQFNMIAEIPFDFSQKYQTVPRPNRRATVYFGTQLISVGCILLKKISMLALPTVPIFAGKSRFFTRNVPLKHSPGWQVCVQEYRLQSRRLAVLTIALVQRHDATTATPCLYYLQ